MPTGGNPFSTSGTTIDGCLFYGNGTRSNSYAERINNTYHVVVRNAAFEGEDEAIAITNTLSTNNYPEDSGLENLTFNNDAFGVMTFVNGGSPSVANFSWKDLQFNLDTAGDIGILFENGSEPYWSKIGAVKVWNNANNTTGMEIDTDMIGVAVTQMNCELHSTTLTGAHCVNSSSSTFKMPTFVELSSFGWASGSPFVFGAFDTGATYVTQFSLLGSTLTLNPLSYSSLPSTSQNGTLIYCNDCQVTNPCTGSGTGALAKRLHGQWVCN
jgi:hypothetical protein